MVMIVIVAVWSCAHFQVLTCSAHRARRVRHGLLGGNGHIFERRRERNGNVHRAHALHRRFQIEERVLLDHRRDLGRDAIASVAFVDHDHARGLLRRLNQRLFIQRPQRARIHHFGADAAFFEQTRRAQRHLHHAAGGDDGDVAAFALDVGDAQRNGVIFLRHRALQPVHHLVFEKHHRVVVADGRFQQALGVVGRRRHHHLQSGNVAEPGVQRLRMLRGRAARGAQRGSHHQRRFPLAARHVMNLGGLVHHLVHGEPDEIAEHDVDHRTHAGHRGAHGNAGEAGFRNRRVEHALGAELFHQAGEHFERMARFGDVFAQNEDARIAAHLFGQRFADGLRER